MVFVSVHGNGVQVFCFDALSQVFISGNLGSGKSCELMISGCLGILSDPPAARRGSQCGKYTMRYGWLSIGSFYAAGAVKRRLEQVRPDSAFWSSEMSMGLTVKPADSMRSRVLGKEAGKIT